MIDTHTHLYSEEFDNDRAAVIARAKAAGVTHCFIPAIDSIYTDRMFALKNDYPDYVFLMNGLHPCNVKENYKEELAHVENLMPTHPFCAIGEIGIDLYWDKTSSKSNKKLFLGRYSWLKNTNYLLSFTVERLLRKYLRCWKVRREMTFLVSFTALPALKSKPTAR